MTEWGDTKSADEIMLDIRAAYDAIDKFKGPRIGPGTKVWENLCAFAVNGSGIEELEGLIDRDIPWNEAFEYGDERDEESMVMFLDPPKSDLLVGSLELSVEKKTSHWQNAVYWYPFANEVEK